MSFASIVLTSGTYNERSPGKYYLSTVNFGEPSNEIRLRPNTNPKNPSFGITRTKQFVVTSGDKVERVNASITLTVNIPALGVPLQQVDGMVNDLSEFISAESLTRLLQGEA